MHKRYKIFIIPVFLVVAVLFTGGIFFSYDDVSLLQNSAETSAVRSGFWQPASSDKIEPMKFQVNWDGKTVYQVTNLQAGKVEFKNFVKGYTIQLPGSFDVNMDRPEIAAILNNGTMQIEIYEQSLSANSSEAVYVSYSNKFLENTKEHKLEEKKTIVVNGNDVHITKWSRDKLKRVNPDYNYYVSADICQSSDKIFSVFIKSTKPLSEANDYLNIISSFKYTGEKYSTSSQEENVTVLKDSDLEENKAVLGVKEEDFVRDYWTEETKQIYNKYFIDSKELTWGIFQNDAPYTFETLKTIEDDFDYEFSFLVYYQHFSRNGISKELKTGLKNAKENNRILELRLQTTSDKKGNMVYGILNGEYDDYLKEFAGAIRDNAFTVLMRFCNEMNGDWCEYSSFHTSKDTMLYRELYHYVFEIFRQEGALPYVIWVFNPNEKSFPNFTWNNEAMYYPGHEYVDVVGLTGYNTGTYYKSEKWRSFTDIYEDYYVQIAEEYEQPLMITEFSSSSVGGDKVAWVEDMFKNIKKYDRIKVAIWWNGRDLDAYGNVSRPYWINETKELVDTFKNNL